jgi:GAF domain-containing protein
MTLKGVVLHLVSLSLRLAHSAAGEDRWPDFAAVAVRLGIGSMLSLPLFVQNETLGALNLYATTPYGFSATDETIAEVFAAYAAIALRDAAERRDLSQAIASRDVIGHANGILMARHHTTAARAFDMLVAASQQTNLKLVHVARWLIA